MQNILVSKMSQLRIMIAPNLMKLVK